jgi:hypothetical protein
MTETTETMTETMTETAETAETEAQTAETEAQTAAHTALFNALKEAGETGKKEWEEIIAKARDLFADEHRKEFKSGVNDAFSRAQDRGADLLLKLIAGIRKGVVALEESLLEARAEEPVVVVEPAPTAA